MRFQVPQFVEIEDKIFWKLTLKQFIFLAGGGGLSVAIFLSLPLYVAILFIAPVVTLSLALAFYQVNNRPFIFLLESAVKYMFNSKLYIWKREDKPVAAAPAEKGKEAEPALDFTPKLSDSKLKDLIWSIDTKESINPVTHNGKTE